MAVALFAVGAALLPAAAWAQFPEPLGQPQLLEAGAGVFGVSVAATAERGESSLASCLLEENVVHRLGPQGLELDETTLPFRSAVAAGPADGVWGCSIDEGAGGGDNLACRAFSRAWVPLGPAVDVYQSNPGVLLIFEIASDAAGNLAVAWRDSTLSSAIRLRLLDAAGRMGPVVDAFENAVGFEELGLARFPSGGLVVVTAHRAPGQSADQILAQLVDASSTPERPFGLTPAGRTVRLEAVRSAGSGFAVMWQHYGPQEILLRRFGPDGQPLAPPASFQTPGQSEFRPQLGCDGWGRCVIFASSAHRFYDAQGQRASGLLPGGLPPGGAAHVLAANASGAFTHVWSTVSSNPQPPFPYQIWSERYQGPPKGDLNADRSTDIVLQSTSTRALELWAMNGTTRLGAPRPIEEVPDPGWHAVGVDDFDGDWNQDLVLWNGASGAVEFWSMGGSDGTKRLAVRPLTGIPPLDPAVWHPAATGDLDADGKPDLLWRNESSGLLRVWTLDGSAYRGTLTPDPPQAPGLSWRVAAAADFDNDGRRDLLWYDEASGSVAFWYLDTALHAVGSQPTNPPATTGRKWQLVGAGEFGSGTGPGAMPAQDLLWRSQAGRLIVWHLDASGNRISGGFTTPDAPANPLDWSIVGPR